MKIGDKVRLDMVGDVKEIWVDSGRHFASVVFCQDDDSNYRVFAALEAGHFRVVEDGGSSEDTGPEIVPGSVVRLKSGGPTMTVCSIETDRFDRLLARCIGFSAMSESFAERSQYANLGQIDLTVPVEALEIAQ